MKKNILFVACTALMAVHAFAVSVKDVCGQYRGDLMLGTDTYNSRSIYLLPGSENNTLTFVLPDFSYGDANLGNIVLTNISMDNNGSLSLIGGTVYVSALNERAIVDIIPSISDGETTLSSVLTASNASTLLRITVASLPEPMLVYFHGSRVNDNYAITNGGFEGDWSNNELNGWHSFPTVVGSVGNLMPDKTKQFKRTTGHTGYGVCLTSNMLLGVKANGNMTNGQINANSSTADSPNDNYNFSDPSNTGYNTPFAGSPDSMSFWVRYVPADRNPNNNVNKARMSTAITTNARYQDPEGSNNYSQVLVAKAEINYTATASMGWQKITVPFSYKNVSRDKTAYILVTFTTNQTPGGGSTNTKGGFLGIGGTTYVDSCYIDDVQLIYNSQLSSLTFNGQNMSVTGVNSVDEPYCDSCYTVEFTTKGVGAKTFIGYDAANRRALVYAVGNDYAANSNSMRIYTIQMSEPTPTGVQDAVMNPTSVKYLRNGRLYILRNGHTYDVMGRMLQ